MVAQPVTIADEIRAAIGATDAEFAERPVALTGGHSAEMYRFRLAAPPPQFGGVLVFRRSATARREATAQGAAHASGYPTPPVIVHGDDFSVMPFVDARTPMAAAGARGIPKLFRTLPALLATTMVRLHALGLACDVPDGTEELLSAVDDVRTLGWLDRNRPAPSQLLLCHCDLHGENLLVADDAVVAVLDWELACLAPAELDVARTRLILAVLPGISSAGRAALRVPARRSYAAFTRAYNASAPLRPDVLRWYDVAWAARQCTIAADTGSVAEVWRPLRARLQKRVDQLIA